MRHFLLILVALVVGYVVWHLMDPASRRGTGRLALRHATRLGLLILAAAALTALAVHLQSTPLF